MNSGDNVIRTFNSANARSTNIDEIIAEFNNENLDSFKENSLNGEAVERTGKKEKSNSKLKKIIAIVLISATIGGVGAKTASIVVDKIETNQIVSEQIWDLTNNIIDNNTHRTDDLQNYWYDYDGMVEDVKNCENQDYAIYGLSQKQKISMNQVVTRLGYENYKDYLDQHGFESEEEYKNVMKDRIVAETKLENINNNYDFSSKGGK